MIERGWIWQLATYMFLHGGALHILFNMLGVWMFGVELERRWGTRFFIQYYAVSGIGGGLTFLIISLLPFQATAVTYVTPAVGASGALFGLLLAFAIYYPERPIMLLLVFVPARIFVMIYGGFALLNTFQPSRGVADAAHLGGMIFGYLYLKGGSGLTAEIRVPLSQVEDEPATAQVRRLLRRSIRFEGQNPLAARQSLMKRPRALHRGGRRGRRALW